MESCSFSKYVGCNYPAECRLPPRGGIVIRRFCLFVGWFVRSLMCSLVCSFVSSHPDTGCNDGSRTLRYRDTSAPQNWCRSLRRITGGAVSHRNCPWSKCPGFSSITALVSRTTFLVSRCLVIGAEVSQSVLMPKCLVTAMTGGRRGRCVRLAQVAPYERFL